MAGRLNPREYDLGELRDATHERSRHRAVEDLSDPAGAEQAAAVGERGVPVETTDDAAPDASGERPSEGGTAERSAESEHSDDEVASYLRSRHQRRRERSTEEPERGRDTDGVEDSTGHSDRAQAPNAATFLAELSGPHVSKPYLDRLPDAYSAQLEVFEWLDELLSAAGHEPTVDALAYYESIGWLSEQSREELEDVASGLSEADATGRTLGIEDHRESLVYVARLAHRRRG